MYRYDFIQKIEIRSEFNRLFMYSGEITQYILTFYHRVFLR
jgi:hypothetical protein